MKKSIAIEGPQWFNSLSEPYMYWIILYKTHLMDALLYFHYLNIYNTVMDALYAMSFIEYNKELRSSFSFELK